jgi:VCBS repeat-containing protein
MNAPNFNITGTEASGSLTEDVSASYLLGGAIAFTDDRNLPPTYTNFQALQPVVPVAHPIYGTPRGTLTASISNQALSNTDQAGTVTWSYTLANGAINDLAEGEIRIEWFTITLVDADGESTSQDIEITITGSNDAPTFTGGPVSATAGEDAASATGSLTFADVDIIDHMHAVAVTGVTLVGPVQMSTASDVASLLTFEPVATLDSSTTGSVVWNFNDGGSNAMFQYLDAGQDLIITYQVTLTDDYGLTATKDVNITITGANDAANIAVTNVTKAETDVSTSETIVIADQVAITDVDASDAVAPMDYVEDSLLLNATAGPAALPIGVMLNSLISFNANSGQITYDRTDFNWLDAGQSVIYTFSFDSQSGNDAAAAQTITITITGENDVASILVGSPPAGVEADATSSAGFAISDYVTITDVDHDDSLAPTKYVPNSGSVTDATGAAAPTGVVLADLLTISSAGAVSYDRAAFNWLDLDQTLTYTISFSSQSGNDAPQSKTLTFAINGENDLATITVTNRAAITENNSAAVVTFNIADQVVITDPDKQDDDAPTDYVAGTGVITTASVLAPPAGTLLGLVTFTAATGEISFDRAAFNWLADGESVTYSVAFNSKSGDDAAVPQNFTFTITGQNDAPVTVSNPTPAVITEPGNGNTNLGTNSRTAVITVSDVDSTDELQIKDGAGGTANVLDAQDNHAIRAAATFNWSAGGTSMGLTALTPSVGGILAGTLSVADRANILNAFAVTSTSFNTVTNQIEVNWKFNNTIIAPGNITVDNNSTGPLPPGIGTININFLARGETLTVTFPITVVDDSGGEHTVNVPIVFTGTNDAATIGVVAIDDSDAKTVTETNVVGVTTTGKLTVADLDLTDVHMATVASISVTGGSDNGILNATLKNMLAITAHTDLTTNGTGQLQWTFTSSETFNYLAVGESLVLAYVIAVADDNSPPVVANKTVTITINGTNDAPTISVEDLVGTVTEANSAVALMDSGTLTFADLDLTDTHLVAASYVNSTHTAQLGTFTAVLTNDTSAGTGGLVTWNFSVNDGVLQFLAAGESIVETYQISLTDGESGGTITRNVAVTITGTNDTPTISVEDLVGAVTEANSALELTNSGTLSFADVDLTDAHTATSSYVGSTHAVQLGTLDAVVTTPTTAGTGGLVTWNFSVNDAAVQFLAAGETIVETYEISLTDSEVGGTITREVEVTITGTNDAPIILVEDLVGAVTEANSAVALTNSGTLSFSDVDLTDTHTVTPTYVGTTHTAQLGTFAAALTNDTSAGTGGLVTWNFSVNDAAVQFLAAGESIVETYQISLTDGESGGTITRDVAVTITGTNDAPEISAGGTDNGAISEAANITGEDPAAVNGSFGFTDADLSDRPGSGNADTVGLATLNATVSVDPTGLTAAQITAAEGLLNRFTPTLAMGGSNNDTINWSFNPNAGEIDFLGLGQVAALTFTIKIDDGNGGSDTRDVTINITGANDTIQPAAGVDASAGSIAENGTLTTSGTIDYRDPDLIGNPIIITRAVVPGEATLPLVNQVMLTAVPGSPAADGTVAVVWSYTNNSNLNFLAAGETRTETFNIRVLDQDAVGALNFPVTISITGTNDAPVLSAISNSGTLVNTEDGDASAQDIATVTGTLTVSDVDTGLGGDVVTASTTNAAVTLNGTAVPMPTGALATLAAVGNVSFANTVTANGSNQTVNWTYNPAAANLDFLAATDVVTLTYTFKVNDGLADSAATQTVTITINGSNDAPVVTGGVTATVDEDAANPATISLLANASDLDRLADLDTSAVTYAVSAGTWAPSVAYAVDTETGALTFDPNQFNALGNAENIELTFTYDVIDGNGGSTPTTAVLTITGSNDAPVVSEAVVATIDEDAANSATVNLLANASDVDRSTDLDTSAVTYAVSAGTWAPSVAYAVDTETGALTFDPNQFNALGNTESIVLTFNYGVTDGFVTTPTTTVVTITGSNDAPTITSASAQHVGSVKEVGLMPDDATPEPGNATATGTLTSADVDRDATATWTVAGTSTYGAMTITTAGVWTYNLNNAFAATQGLIEGQVVTETFTATVEDDSGARTDQTITITINGTNDTPTITFATGADRGDVVEAGSLDDGTIVAGAPTASGTLVSADVDNPAITTWSIAGTSTYGTMVITGAGVWTYTLSNSSADNLIEGQTVRETFTATVTDDKGATATQMVSVYIAGTNDAPTVTTSTMNQSTAEDASFSYVLSASTFADVDLDDELTLTATLADGSPLPTWLVFDAALGSFSGTPLNVNVGVITVKVTATDLTLASVSSSFALTVTNTNDAPTVAIAIIDQSTAEDAVFSYVLPAGTFADVDVGDSLTLTATLDDGSALPSWMSFNASSRTFSGTPLNGDVGVITVKVSATDSSIATVSDSFTLTVTNTNDAPVNTTVAGQDIGTVNESSNYVAPVIATVSGILSATDVDVGDMLAWSISGVATYGTISITTGGVWTYSLDQSLANVLGTGDVAIENFIAKVMDSAGAFVTQNISVTINGTNEIFVGDGFDNSITGSSFADDISGLDGDDLLTGGSGADNIYGGTGSDTINGGSGEDKLFGNENDDILNGGDNKDTLDGGAGSDTIVGGSGADDTVILSGNWADYTVVQTSIVGSGTFQFTNTGAGAEAGDTDTVSQTEFVKFGSGAAVAIGNALNDAPVAIDHGGFTVLEDGSVSIPLASLLAGATDVDSVLGDILAISAVGGASTGTVTIAGANAVFTPAENFNGTATFTYTVSDLKGGSDIGQATITVNPVNDAPVAAAAAESASGDEDTAITGTLLAGSDVDSSTLTFALVPGSASNGAVVINAMTGAYSFAPIGNYNGPASFQYVVNDGTVDSAAKVVNITVAAVNDAPVAAAATESALGDEDTAITGTLLAGSDVDSSTLTFALVPGSASNGTVVINAATGAYSFTPTSNYNGPASFQYVVDDGALDSVAKVVSITVNLVNDAPFVATALGDQAGTEDAAFSFTVPAGSFSDVDNATLTLSLGAGSPAWLSITAAGVISGTPPLNVNGTVSVEVIATDAAGLTVSDSFDIAIAAVNDAPVAAAPILVSGSEDDASIAGAVTGTDVDLDILTYVLVTGSVKVDGVAAADGRVIFVADGSYSYNPSGDQSLNAGENRLITFQYRAYDGNLFSNPSTVSIQVNGLREVVVGTVGNDPSLTGTAFADEITGLTGDDTISALAGDDIVLGGAGNDIIHAGVGSDSVNGGDDQDVIVVGTGTAGDVDSYDGGGARDLLDMSSITNGGVWIDFGYNLGPNQLFTFDGLASVINMESMIGTQFGDVLRGDSGSNYLGGGQGNDTILGYSPYDTLNPYASLGDVMEGGEGNDTLFSGTGNDYLDGGTGDDAIELGGGTDTAIGGIGNDTFYFSPRTGTDTILDFEGGDGVAAGHGDILSLYNFGEEFDTFAEVYAASSQVGNDTHIVLTDATIILQNYLRTNLVSDDVLIL